MPSKRSILEELTLDELRTNLDRYDLEVDDRRVRTQLVDALASARQARLGDILVDLSRKRLQDLCRSLGLVHSGHRKAELVQRLSGSASPPRERPPADARRSADSLALERVLLQNLLERLDADAATEQPRFRSVVSDAERSALRVLLGVGGSSPPTDPAPTPRPSSPRPPTPGSGRTPPPVELNTAALDPVAEPLPGWVLCLDFGTAKSKAFAATDEEEEPELEPLAVGQADDDLDRAVYEVSSCVWIDDDGRLFVGSEAVKRGMNYGHELVPHRPLDSLKQEISQVDPEEGAVELDRKLPQDVDRTLALTYFDAITIYLAYLTDLATTALESRLGTRYVRRRFTVPSWRPSQRRWAAEMLGKSLLRAQLLADTFHDRWREGIPIEHVAHAVRAAAEYDGELTRLAATGPEDATDWEYGTLEALAAASARVWADRRARNLMLVVDVGAGTTDLSLFWVVQQDGKFRRAWPIGADAGIRQAGDTLDRLLVKELLRKEGLGVDETGKRAGRALERRARRLKEALFETGSITETLVNDATVTLSREEFIDSDGVRRFTEAIAGKIQELLAGVDESWGRAESLTLVLTGGGCDLPMIAGLQHRDWRIGTRKMTCRLAPRVPDGLADRFSSEFVQAYPRLAVAMGGALRMMLDEKNPMRVWMGGATEPGRLERFQTRGL